VTVLDAIPRNIIMGSIYTYSYGARLCRYIYSSFSNALR